MNIAVSLEGTLSTEKDARLALRPGARELLRELAQAGHRLTLYTTLERTPLSLWLWFRLRGMPLHRVVVAHASPQPWPPLTGQDLVVDSARSAVAQAWQQGVLGVQVHPDQPDWAAPVRETILAWSLEALGYPFASSLQNHGMGLS